MSKKIIGIIPARIGSTRFPKKMLADVKGKPLIQLTYENALRCKKLDDLVVATDDSNIYDVVRSFGGQVVMTSTDCPSGTDRAAEAIRNNPFLQDAEIVINIQGDEPTIDPSTIECVAEVLEQHPQANVSTACLRITNKEDTVNPSVVKCVMNLQGRALYFSRALIPHDKSGCFNKNTTYYKHIGIYAYRSEFLQHYSELSSTPLQIAEDLEQLKILEHGFYIQIAEVYKDCAGIDTPTDLLNLINREAL